MFSHVALMNPGAKKTIHKRHGSHWSKKMTIDMKNLQAPRFLCEGIIGGPYLPYVSNLKSP